mgnify:CR=1 FL=1
METVWSSVPRSAAPSSPGRTASLWFLEAVSKETSSSPSSRHLCTFSVGNKNSRPLTPKWNQFIRDSKWTFVPILRGIPWGVHKLNACEHWLLSVWRQLYANLVMALDERSRYQLNQNFWRLYMSLHIFMATHPIEFIQSGPKRLANRIKVPKLKRTNKE